MQGSYRRSVPGLIGALVVVLVLIASIWALSRLTDRGTSDPATTVDYSASLAEARHAAPFDVLAPSPAPLGWRATSAEWDGVGPEVSWHLGFLTSDGDYVGLEQGNAPATDFVPASTPATQPADTVMVGAQRWQSLVSDDGDEHALVRQGRGVTTVVTGTAPVSDLLAFAASLRPS